MSEVVAFVGAAAHLCIYLAGVAFFVLLAACFQFLTLQVAFECRMQWHKHKEWTKFLKQQELGNEVSQIAKKAWDG